MSAKSFGCPALAHMPLGTEKSPRPRQPARRGAAGCRRATLARLSGSTAGRGRARDRDRPRRARSHLSSIGSTALLTLPADRVENDDAGAGSVDPDLLDGVVKGAEGDSTIKILNPQRLLRDEFARLGVSGARAADRVSISAGASSAAAPEQQQVSLVSFDLGAAGICASARTRAGDHSAAGPGLGGAARRNRRAGRGHVARPVAAAGVVARAAGVAERASIASERGKVVVLSMGNGAVGMVADRTREILRVDPDVIDPAPALLTRGAGDAEITSICRLDQGRRLVAMLSPDGCSDPNWCAAFLRSRAMRSMIRQANGWSRRWLTSNSSSSGWAIRSTDCRSERWTRSRVRPTRSPGSRRRPRSSTG